MFLVAVLIQFVSCNDPTIVYIPGPQTGLVGTWDWFESIGGSAGDIDTSNSSFRAVLIFKSDSVVVHYNNGSVSSQGRFYIERRYDPAISDSIDFLLMESPIRFTTRYYYNISNNDTLRLELWGATDVGGDVPKLVEIRS